MYAKSIEYFVIEKNKKKATNSQTSSAIRNIKLRRTNLYLLL